MLDNGVHSEASRCSRGKCQTVSITKSAERLVAPSLTGNVDRANLFTLVVGCFWNGLKVET